MSPPSIELEDGHVYAGTEDVEYEQYRCDGDINRSIVRSAQSPVSRHIRWSLIHLHTVRCGSRETQEIHTLNNVVLVLRKGNTQFDHVSMQIVVTAHSTAVTPGADSPNISIPLQKRHHSHFVPNSTPPAPLRSKTPYRGFGAPTPQRRRCSVVGESEVRRRR